MSEEYEYEKEMDFHYENSGANMSEMQHAKDCEWIYDNCTCGLIEYLDYNIPDDGEYQYSGDIVQWTSIAGFRPVDPGSNPGVSAILPKFGEKKFTSEGAPI